MQQLTLIFFLFASLLSNAQTVGHTLKLKDGKESPAATIDQFAWIAGHWRGEAFGGGTEEIWTPPAGGTMMGAFKLIQNDQVAFYELCTLREVDGSVLLQIRHFHDDLKAWEEKNETVDFQLVKVTNDKAFFDEFTFERINENELHIYVVIDQEDSPSKEVQFIYKRVN